MIGIVCLEERRGMQFGGRRVSRDRVVTEKICELCEGKTLWMNLTSEKLFAEQKESGKVTLQAAADFLEQAGEGEYCFVENTGLQVVEAKIEKIIVFWWNRHYPSDRKFDLDLSKWNKVSEEEFAGYSHEKITKEVYEK